MLTTAQSGLKDPHEFTGVHLHGLFVVDGRQVAHNVSQLRFHVQLPLVLHPELLNLFLFQQGQILCLHIHNSLLKLAEIVNLSRRRSFKAGQVQFELFVVRKEELRELLQRQTVSCGFVFHGTGSEGHGLLERGVDSHLVQTHVYVLRIDRTFILAVPLIEDFVQVAP